MKRTITKVTTTTTPEGVMETKEVTTEEIGNKSVRDWFDQINLDTVVKGGLTILGVVTCVKFERSGTINSKGFKFIK